VLRALWGLQGQSVDLIELGQHGDKQRVLVQNVMKFQAVRNSANFLTSRGAVSNLERTVTWSGF
jgi:hypothetical protein